jgi:tape measure domain-containing protein
MANSYQESIDKAKRDIIEIKSSLGKLHEDILQNASAFRNLLQSTGVSNLKEFNSLVAQNNKLTKQNTELKSEVTKTQKDYNTAVQKQIDLLAKNQNSLKATTEEEIKYEKSMKKAFDRQKEYARAYSELSRKQKQAKKNLQDLIVTHGTNNRKVKQAQKEYDRLSKKINQANKATSNFSKTGLGGMVRGFKNLLGAFGLVMGISMIADFTRNIFVLTRELNSLSFSIKTVIKDELELAQTTEFLRKITNDYGADIVSTTKRYIKFRAASKEANLTASETQKIFGTVTKAAGVLGLKTDELTGIYLALEQMISKGKVTTEELRRQLGERLPGAFDIMAKAVGVSTSKLDKMLKKGEVLSAEALPKFVVALEKAYGIETVSKIETMVASQIRMNNAFKNLVISVEKDGGAISNIFKFIFDDMTDVLQQIERLNKTQENLLEQGRFGEYQDSLKSIPKEWENITNHVKNFGSEQDKQLLKQQTYLKFLKNEKIAQEDVVLSYAKNISLLSQKRKRLNEIDSLLKIAGPEKGALMHEQKQLNLSIEKLQKDKRSLALAKGRLDAIKELIKLQTNVKVKPKEDDVNTKKQKDETLELLKIGAEANKKLVEDDERTFSDRTELLDKLLVRRRLINQKTLENDLKAAGKNEDLQKLAQAKFMQRLDKDLQEEQTLRKSIQKDVLDDIKENLKEIEDASKVSRNKEIIEANGDKDKLKEIEKRHFKAVLELQSNYIADVLRENENLTDEQVKILVDMLSKMGAEMTIAADKTISNLKDIQKQFKDIFGTVTDTFSNAFDIDASKFDFVFDELAKGFDNLDETTSKLFDSENIGKWADATKELIGGVLNASMQRFEFEIEASRRTRDTILNDELATEEQKKAARRKFEADERRIRTERAKQERENTLIQIAVDTAAGVAKVLAQTGAVAPFVIPSIIALGLAQAAFVASQPLPKFEVGTSNAPEGLAYTDEKGAEIHTDKKGNIKDFGSNKGARIKYLNQGDKILNATKTKEIMNGLSSSDIQNAVFNMNMRNNGEIIKDNVVDLTLLREISAMKKSNEKVWSEVKKLANRPINVQNDVTLPNNRPY